MRHIKFLILVPAVLTLAACGQTRDEAARENAATGTTGMASDGTGMATSDGMTTGAIGGATGDAMGTPANPANPMAGTGTMGTDGGMPNDMTNNSTTGTTTPPQ